MKNIWILFLILAFQVGPVLAQSELGPRLGHIIEDEYSIQRTGVGIERYVEGKRQNDPFERWDFQCGKDSPNETYCSVERTVFTNWAVLGTVISRELHTTENGTLKLVYVDWEAGELDFQLIFLDGNTIEVKLRVQYQGGSIYLKDFQAMGIFIMFDKMEAIEFRIPEYTYTRDIPVGMRGLKSEDDKRREEMLQ